MKAVRVLFIPLCVAAGCDQTPSPADDGPNHGAAAPAEHADAELVGTTWMGYISHQNAEGVSTRITWQFQAEGVLLHHRHWDDNKQTGTWQLEEGVLVVKVGEYGKRGYGTIDLQWTGDAMKGETRWRSGYGFGWEFELERQK